MTAMPIDQAALERAATDEQIRMALHQTDKTTAIAALAAALVAAGISFDSGIGRFTFSGVLIGWFVAMLLFVITGRLILVQFNRQPLNEQIP